MDSPVVVAEPRTAPAMRPQLHPTVPAIVQSSSSALLAPALVWALLLWLCYFPLNCGWIGWVAYVPFLALARSPFAPRRVYLAGWLAALLFYVVVLQWVRVADYRMYASWLALAFYCSLYVPVGLYLVRRLDRATRLPLTLTFPAVWTALELLRAHLLGGFAWYYVGHTQHNFLPAIQIADIGGVYAVSFLVAAVNAAVYENLQTLMRRVNIVHAPSACEPARTPSPALQGVLVLVLLAGSLGYGLWRLQQTEFEVGPRVALLQGNLDQRLRNAAFSEEGALEAIKQCRRHYADLCDEAARLQPELIIWPETCFNYGWPEVAPGLPEQSLPADWRGANQGRQDLAKTAAQRWPSNLLLGLTAETLDEQAKARRHNSAVLVRRDGEIAGRYDKVHCVPFGEYVPFRDWLPWMNKFAPYDFDYSVTPGEHLTRFRLLDRWNLGVIICYEDTDPGLVRGYLQDSSDGPPVDFLVNISNDGWFDGTSEHEQHLATCRFRAVESRRAVVRAVNMGISAVIDGNGRVVSLPGEDWALSKKVEKVLAATIPIDTRTSLYARLGDWLPLSCWLLIIGSIGTGLVSKGWLTGN